MNDAAHAEDPAPADAAGPTPPQSPLPPLRRSRRQKVVAGVCGGLGRQWDLDPVIFRIVLAVLAVGGLGFIAYGFAWLIIPMDGEEENEGRRLLSGRVEGSALTALLLALIGCGLFLTTVGKGSAMSFAIMLSLTVGGSAYWSRRRRQAEADGLETMDAATAQAVADAPPETKAPPTPNSPSWWRDPRSKEAMAANAYLWGPESTPLDITYTFEHGAGQPGRPAERGERGAPPGAGRPPHPVGAPRKVARAGRPIGGWTFLLALLTGTVTALAVARYAGPTASLQAGLAGALVVLGLGLVLSTWFGRTGGGTVFMVALTSLLLAGATVLPDNLTTHWQYRSWTPTSLAAVQQRYDVGSGEGTLDLGSLAIKDGRTVRTSAEVGAGRLKVTLPPGVTIKLRTSIGLGDIQMPNEAYDNVDFTAGSRQRTVTLPPDGLAKGEKPRGSLDLTLKVGVGQIEIQRATSGSPDTSSAPASPPATPSGPAGTPSTAPTPQGAPS
jgi:phage shock protein PspC (stress-responsive transcriptional regulator)